MPDFTYEWYQACTNTILSDKFVSARNGPKVTYETTVSLDGKLDQCSCPGYNFHRHCRHINELRLQLCDWSSQHSPEAQTPEQEMRAICPKCGSPTQAYREAV